MVYPCWSWQELLYLWWRPWLNFCVPLKFLQLLERPTPIWKDTLSVRQFDIFTTCPFLSYQEWLYISFSNNNNTKIPRKSDLNSALCSALVWSALVVHWFIAPDSTSIPRPSTKASIWSRAVADGSGSGATGDPGTQCDADRGQGWVPEFTEFRSWCISWLMQFNMSTNLVKFSNLVWFVQFSHVSLGLSFDRHFRTWSESKPQNNRRQYYI